MLDDEINHMFNMEVAALIEIAASLRNKRREGGEKTFGWCFVKSSITAGDLEEVDDSRRRKFDADDMQSTNRFKRIRHVSPTPPPESQTSRAYSPLWTSYNFEDSIQTAAPNEKRSGDRQHDSNAKKDRAERGNVLRRFNLATSSPSLKTFIQAAKSAGANIYSNDFGEKVMEQQLIKLKEANKVYMRKKLITLREQFSEKQLEERAEDEYNKTYAASFDQDFKPILIKKHIQYAIEDMEKQVRLKIKNRSTHYDKKKLKELKKALLSQIREIAARWKKDSPGCFALKEYYVLRRNLFNQIDQACPDYKTHENDDGFMSS